MWLKSYLVFGLIICFAYGWAMQSGYELGDDAASTWTQQSANHFHK